MVCERGALHGRRNTMFDRIADQPNRCPHLTFSSKTRGQRRCLAAVLHASISMLFFRTIEQCLLQRLKFGVGCGKVVRFLATPLDKVQIVRAVAAIRTLRPWTGSGTQRV